MTSIYQSIFEVRTSGQGFYEIDPVVRTWMDDLDIGQGLLTLFIQHSSASLLIQENADADVPRDLLDYLGRLVPPANDPSMTWMRHVAEGPDDMPAHIKAAVLPVSLSIPVSQGRMMLGTWQGIFIVEHRAAPRLRKVVAHLVA